MENNNTHITHNLSCSISETRDNRNNSNSSSSSDKEYFEKLESEIRWSKIIKKNTPNNISNSILNEEDINITNKSYEERKNDKENKGKGKSKVKYKYYKYKNKKYLQKYLGDNFRMLENGILVKTLNRFKKGNNPPVNQFILKKEKKEKNIMVISKNNDNNFLPKFRKSIKDSFQLMFIKRPTRSFITKVCKYKKTKYKKIKENKKIKQTSSVQTSDGLDSRIHAYSSRFTPSSTIIIQRKFKEKNRTKSLIRNKSQTNDISENKIFSLSTNSVKKISMNSNGSFYYNKSNNLLITTNLKKRPLSSINIPKNDNDLNLKYSKIDNFDITTYNKSNNNAKTRPVSSMMNSQINKGDKLQLDNEKTIIYENANFMNQFKELKNAFETYDFVNNNNNDNNNIIIRAYNYNNKYNSFRENHNQIKDIKKLSKNNSAKLNKISQNQIYFKNISPLYFPYNNKFEDEKQNKLNKYCNKCGYQKHFGNEKICPLCVELKEQNQLREEKLSNKYYYYPFKDKYETNYSQQNIFKKYKNTFNNLKVGKKLNNDLCLKYINQSCFNNSPYLNNIFNSPSNIRRKFIRNKIRNKNSSKKRRTFFDKYDVIQKYFG